MPGQVHNPTPKRANKPSKTIKPENKGKRRVMFKIVDNEHGTPTSQNRCWLETTSMAIPGSTGSLSTLGRSDCPNNLFFSPEKQKMEAEQAKSIDFFHRAVWRSLSSSLFARRTPTHPFRPSQRISSFESLYFSTSPWPKRFIHS